MTNHSSQTQDHTERPQPTASIGRDGVQKFVVAASSSLSEVVTLVDLLPHTGVAFNTLTRNFKEQFGLTPMHWLWALRAYSAAAMMAEIPGSNITSVAFFCGFSSSSHFSRKFSSVFSVTPSKLRKTFRNQSLCQQAKKELLVSLVKKKYLPCLPLMIESISQNKAIVSIYNPKSW